MPRRTLTSLLALGLAAVLALPATSAAAATSAISTPLLSVEIGDSSIAVSTPTDVVAVDATAVFVGEIATSASLPDGTSVSSAGLVVDAVSGPGDVLLRIADLPIGAGDTAPIPANGGASIAAEFPTAGRYSVEMRVLADLAVLAQEGASTSSVASDSLVIEFEVAAPAVVEEIPAPEESVASRGAAIGAAPGHSPPASEGVGPAPVPVSTRVLAGIHTDAVSTFVDGGTFVLGSKADVAEGSGTRFAADEVRFHLEDAARVAVPAGFDFIAVEGSTVWIAPESNPGAGRLWPGFSTESVPGGGVVGDTTTFTLTGFTGPGDLELYTGGGTASLERLWSTDEGIASFEVGRTHSHANWAFTAPGTYRLAVEASAVRGGNPVSASTVYTFVVGELPVPTATTTTLEVSDAEVETGESVTLTARVEPANAGYVEFHDGGTPLWHTPLVDGAAAFTTEDLAIGARSLTAVFVPAVADDVATSASDASTVTVSQPGGVGFGIAGVEPEYRVGDTLTARVVGYTLAEGEVFRWVMRPSGSTSSGAVVRGSGTESPAGRFTQALDASNDAYELSVQVRRGSTTVSQTAWSTLRVPDAAGAVSGSFPDGVKYLGDEVIVPVEGAVDPEHTLRLAYRYGTGWYAYADATLIDGPAFDVAPTWPVSGAQWAVQVLDGDLVVAQSEPFTGDVLQREAMLQGVRSVYRDGQTLEATGTVYPEFDGVTYEWLLSDGVTEVVTLKAGTGEEARRLSMPVDASFDRSRLYFEAVVYLDGERVALGWTSTELRVSTVDPDEQLLFLETLAHHYHQGYAVDLALVADPALADGDTVTWQWRWPGSEDWIAIPGAAGPEHELVAEQALDGVEVRAVVDVADSDTVMVSDPDTIYVDDHGSPARQVVTVTGATTVDAGADVTLTASTAAATVLSEVRWERRAPGEADFSVVAGATSPEWTFTAAPADDAAEYRAAFVTPAGALAYGPSAYVTLDVTPAPPAAGTRPIALTEGHIDLFEVTYDAEAGGLRLLVKEDTQRYGSGSQYHDPSDVAVWVDSELSAMQVPVGAPAFAFLGEGGSTIYHLPFGQDQALPWPGWSTERLLGSLPTGTTLPTSADAVKLAVEVTGPGEVFTWMSGAFGTPINRFIDTVDPAPDVIPIARNAHVHTAWAFTAIGEYTFVVTPTATTTDGRTLSGEAATYRIQVGPAAAAAPSAVSMPTISGAGGVGESLTFDAGTWLPRPHTLQTQWLLDGRPIDGQTGSAYTPDWADLGHEISLRVVAGVGAAQTVVESAPVLVVRGAAPQPDEEPVQDDELDDASRGDILLVGSAHHPGATLVIDVGESRSTEWMSVWLHSDPTWLGWTQVGADGRVAVTIPPGTALGDHRVVLKDRTGSLVGWAPVAVSASPAAEQPTPPLAAPANQCVAGATVISAGHVDIASRLVGGRLQTLIGDDSAGSKVYREPSGTVLWLKPSGAVRLPAGLGQVGAEGSTMWIVPQTQNRDLVWLGWSTEALGSASVSSPVTWTIDSVSGPGAMKVYTTGSFGGVQSMVFDGRGSYDIPLGIHAHANWAFSAEGVYRLAMTQSAVLANGQRSTDRETLTIVVGDVDPAAAAAGGTGCGTVSAAFLADEGLEEDALADAATTWRDGAGIRSVDAAEAPATDRVSEAGALVPALLGVLGGLLLLAAVATGVLLWRRRRLGAG